MNSSQQLDIGPCHRMTRQRRMTLDELRRMRSHPTAEEVYRKVKRAMPRISLATVYRNLDVLSRCGLIQKLRSGDGPARYDSTCEKHHHVRCVRCGKIADVHLRGPAREEVGADGVSGYEILGCNLEFVGLCPACRKPNRRKTPVQTGSNRAKY